MIEKNRLVAITDGIIAVAATVMVLRLEIPDVMSTEAIRSQWPTLLAYMISFVQIFLAWHEHHDTFVNAKKLDHIVFLWNIGWLFCITLLPFLTGIVGKSPDHFVSVLFYILLLSAQQGILMALGRSVQKLNGGGEMQDALIIRKLRITAFCGYGAGIIVALIQPVYAIVLIVLVSIVEIIQVVHFDLSMRKMEN